VRTRLSLDLQSCREQLAEANERADRATEERDALRVLGERMHSVSAAAEVSFAQVG
jgi:hypothetical protein